MYLIMTKNNDQYFLPIEGIEFLLTDSKNETACEQSDSTRQCKIISFSKVTKEVDRKKELDEINVFLEHYKIF